MIRPKKLDHLKVVAFTKPERKGFGKTFSFLINPESLVTEHTNQFSRRRGINTSGRKAEYALSSSKEMSLQLTLDNTMVRDDLPGLPSSPRGTIKQQVESFLTYCFEMDGSIHEPRFLLVEWGDFSFKCRLKSVKATYLLFNEQGEPLRARLDTVFLEDMTETLRQREEGKESPDITHVRTVLQGHTLTGLTKEIYGDASHYLLVAEANGLDNFRVLVPGSQLYFPPLVNH